MGTRRLSSFEWCLIGILLLSFVLRLICLLQVKSSPFFGFFAPDAYHYDQFALNILRGDLLFKESVFVFPLYPLFLSGIYLIAGHHLIAVGVVQILLDTLSCALLYFISVKIFDRKSIGLIAAFIYAFYSLLVFYPSFLLGTTLSIFVNLFLFFVLISVVDKDDTKRWLWAGVVMGISFLISASNALFLFLFIWWCLKYIKDKLPKIAVSIAWLLLGIGLVTAPFSMRNYVIEKKFSVFPEHSGLSFYRGNNPNATGTYEPIAGVSDIPVNSIKDSIAIAEHESGRSLTFSEASDFWFSKAVSFIKTNPNTFVALMIRKFTLFWNDVELTPDVNYYFCKRYIHILQLPLFTFGCIAPFAILGILFIFEEKLKRAYLMVALVFVYMISLMLFFVTDRYRLPAVPFIIMLGAYGISYLATLVKAKQTKRVGVLVLLLAFLFILINWNFKYIQVKNNFSTEHFNLGQIYYKSGKINESIAEYQKALSNRADFAYAHYNLGLAYNRKNMIEEAIKEYQTAIQADPHFARAYSDLGVVYRREGLMDQAIVQYKKAIALDQTYVIAYYNLGNIYLSQGHADEAIAEYQQVLKLNPNFSVVYNNIVSAYAAKGDFVEAVFYCDKAQEKGFPITTQLLKSLEPYRNNAMLSLHEKN